MIGDVLVVVRSLRYRDARDAEAEIAESADAVGPTCRVVGVVRCWVAYGTPAVGADQIRESYRAGPCGSRDWGNGWGYRVSVSYHDLRGYGVLELVAETERE